MNINIEEIGTLTNDELKELGLVKVSCKYYDYEYCKYFCDSNPITSRIMYSCRFSIVKWTFYLMNKKHLDEVKDD